MQRLSGLSRRYLRERRGRTILAASGIAIGVAVLFSALVTIDSYNRGLERYRFASPGMDVSVWPMLANGGYLSDDTVDGLARLDGVDAVLRVHDVPVSLASEERPHTTHTASGQFLFGVDVAELARFEAIDPLYDITPTVGRRFAEDADEVMLSESRAAFLGVTAGDHLLTMNLPTGQHRLLVTGLLPDEGIARRNTGRLLFTSLSTARRLDGRQGTASFAALHLDRGIDPETWIESHAREVDGHHFEGPDAAVGYDRSELADLGAIYTLFAALVLFVAGFLIFLTLSMAVAERQATLGVLRALGASRHQLSRLVLVESLVLGAVATAVGLAAGYGIAHVSLTYEPMGPTPFPSEGVPVTPVALAVATGLGVGATLLAALVPARRAGRLAPLDAIREPVGLAGDSRRAWIFGVVALPAGCLVAAQRPDDQRITGLGLLLALGGAMLVVPAVLPRLCGLLAGLRSVGPTRMAHLVLPHLRRERTRSAYTLGLAMVVMAMAIAMGAASASAMHTGETQLAAQVANTLTLTSGNLDADLVRRVAAVEGIEAATPVWWGGTEVEGHDGPIQRAVVAIEPATHFAVSSFAWVEGSDRSVQRHLARSGHVAITEYVAERLDVSVGDPITLATAQGHQPFVVAGVYVSIAPSTRNDTWGAIVMSRRDGEAFFNFGWPASVITARIASGADPDEVAANVEALRAPSIFVVLTPDQVRSSYDDITAGARNLLASLLVPAAAVSALGLANTLAVAVLERRREIGVLRAVGLSRGQARAMALLEAGVLVAVAAVLAVPLGYLLSRPVVDVTAVSFGTTVHYAFPWNWLGITGAMALVLAAVAALAPARRAARLDVSAALRFE